MYLRDIDKANTNLTHHLFTSIVIYHIFAISYLEFDEGTIKLLTSFFSL